MLSYEHEFVDARGGCDEWGAAAVADFDDDGDLEIVGKIWHPNLPNGNGTEHHVSCLDPVAPDG